MPATSAHRRHSDRTAVGVDPGRGRRGSRQREVGSPPSAGKATVGVDARVGPVPVPDAEHAIRRFHGRATSRTGSGRGQDPPGVVSLPHHPSTRYVGRLACVGAVVIPDCSMWLWSRSARARHASSPAQPVRRRTGGEREVDCDGHVDAVVDVEVHGSNGSTMSMRTGPTTNVCGSSPAALAWRAIVGVPSTIPSWRASSSPRREVGHREDDDVAEAVTAGAERRTGSPTSLLVGDDVRQRLGDLVDEVLVEHGQLGHVAPGEARGSRGQDACRHGGQPS